MWGDWEHMKQSYEDKVNDPWDWVTHFENAVARYTGAKHAIAVDSASNGIKLCLNYVRTAKVVNIPKKSKMHIPANTYVSVPNQIILEGFIPVFEHKQWERHYTIGSSGIIDAAVSFYENMFEENIIDDGSMDTFMCLSFHHRKIINIGKGGMILTNSDRFNEWVRPMIYDGRKKYMNYEIDEFECIGWHCYMTPEDARKGLEIFHSDKIQSVNKPVGSWETYKDLTKQKIFRQYDSQKSIVTYNANNDVILNNLRVGKYRIYDYLFNMQFKGSGKLILDVNPDDFHDAFEKLDLKSFNENVNFIIYDNIECFSDYKEDSVIKLLKFIFKRHGMENRLKFYGNNLDFSDKDINYEPIPFFIGDSSWQSKHIEDRKFEKKFLFLANAPKMERCQILIELEKRKLLEDTYYTFNINNKPLPPGFSKFEILQTPKSLDTEQGKLFVNRMHKILPEYEKSFMNIISESYFYLGSYDQMNMNEKPTFITEKTEKCFTSGSPFVVFSTKGYLKKLKELGFKTFDKWWDESYDNIESDAQRFNEIFNVINEISSWSYEKCQKVYSEMIDVLRYNQLHNYKFDHVNKKISLDREAYLNSIQKRVKHLDDLLIKSNLKSKLI